MIIFSLVCTPAAAKRKLIKDYIGKWYVSTYKPHDSSQNGHGTSSGHRAKSGRTVAVDHRNPKAKMLTWVHIQGFGKLRVEDIGGFGRFNGGRRAFDVFRENWEKGGLWLKKCWIYRKETKKEYKARLKREEREREQARKRRQKGEFILVYDKDLLPHQVVTDPNFIKGGCISFGGGWFEVIKTKRGLGNKIRCGLALAEQFEIKVKLDMLEEGAVG
jgi:hypothetical protein